MRITSYPVRHADEECQCPECGYPLYVQDMAYVGPDDVPCCSPRCVKATAASDAVKEIRFQIFKAAAAASMKPAA